MSSKSRRTPKKKLEENILLQAVNQFVKPQKKTVSLEKNIPKRKTPKNKTPKQKGGKEENFLNKIEDMLFSMNHVEFNGIGIDTTFTPLDDNKDKSERMFTEITQKNVQTSKKNRTLKSSQMGGKPVRVFEESEEGEETPKGGYGKTYINNHVRLYEGPRHYLYSSV
jgi:hypothetical protein